MQECEAILTVEPSALEIVAMLGEIETRLQQAGQIQEEAGVHNALVAYRAATPSASSGLLEIGGRSTGQVGKRISLQNPEQGNDQLGKFLVLQQMFPEDEMSAALEAVKEANKAMNDRTLATSLLAFLCQDNDEKMEAVLSAMIDRTKFAYVPLEYYDIDRQVVRMLPDELTIKRLFVPFDLISRTIMVAVL